MALQAYKQAGIELVYRLHRALASRHDRKISFTGCNERVPEEKLKNKCPRKRVPSFTRIKAKLISHCSGTSCGIPKQPSQNMDEPQTQFAKVLSLNNGFKNL